MNGTKLIAFDYLGHPVNKYSTYFYNFYALNECKFLGLFRYVVWPGYDNDTPRTSLVYHSTRAQGFSTTAFNVGTCLF